MKLRILISLLLGNVIIFAQTDSSGTRKDTGKTELSIPFSLMKKNMVIQKKDMPLIKPIEGMNFVIEGDTLTFTKEEIESGLTVEELKTIRANKDSLLSYIKPNMINEEKEYPFLYRLRKILGAAKTIGVIIILIMSLL